MGPRFRISSERLEKPGIEPTTPGLEGKQLSHYAMEASGSRLTIRGICPRRDDHETLVMVLGYTLHCHIISSMFSMCTNFISVCLCQQFVLESCHGTSV